MLMIVCYRGDCGGTSATNPQILEKKEKPETETKDPEAKNRQKRPVINVPFMMSYMIIIAYCILILALGMSAIATKFGSQSNIETPLNVWNTTALKQELKYRIIGQDDASSNIESSIYEPMFTINRKDAFFKAIFLMGGPGVGKNLAIDTIYMNMY